ncbi:PEP-CTERM sorting domain-containing protein [Undibacterium sp. Rencai35W]|uniref:PEP-CTERM sorting domain-containing protein n=1 Tax=Undibacterium sp. Rencai35W TaxID=3413046 RepID=UPI003BF37E26
MSFFSKFKAAVLLSVAMMVGASANATPIFNNGSYTTNIGGYCSSCGTAGQYTMFDDFTLTNAYSNLQVEWDASFFHPLSTNIIIKIWSANNSGLLYTKNTNFVNNDYYTVNTGSINANANITTAFTLTGVNLSAGTYWLSLSGDDMHFQGTGNGSQIAASQLGTGYAPNQGLNIPFRLYATNAVPEPSGLFLFGLGLLLFVSVRRFVK